MPTFNYSVNDESQSTEEHVLTPMQILELAGIDPATNYLVEIKGSKQESYKDRSGEEIHMHQKLKFISSFIGPVPVS